MIAIRSHYSEYQPHIFFRTYLSEFPPPRPPCVPPELRLLEQPGPLAMPCPPPVPLITQELHTYMSFDTLHDAVDTKLPLDPSTIVTFTELNTALPVIDHADPRSNATVDMVIVAVLDAVTCAPSINRASDNVAPGTPFMCLIFDPNVHVDPTPITMEFRPPSFPDTTTSVLVTNTILGNITDPPSSTVKLA